MARMACGRVSCHVASLQRALEDVDVEVAVSGVAITDAVKAELGADALDGGQEFRQVAPRHHRVFFFVGRVGLDGFAHLAAQVPQLVLSCGVHGHEGFAGIEPLQGGGDAFELRHEVRFPEGVDFDEQVGRGIGGEGQLAVAGEVHGERDGGPLHEFQCAGLVAVLEEAGYGAAGVGGIGKGHEQQRVVLRPGQQFERGFCDDAQRAF